jgi:hypothetical protein
MLQHSLTRSMQISLKCTKNITRYRSLKMNNCAVKSAFDKTSFPLNRFFSTSSESSKTKIDVTHVKSSSDHDHNSHDHTHDHDHHHDTHDDEMEQEDMFVEAHASLGHGKIEWGGPRRGGRLEEPTRYGDWERKGRCTDF